MSGFMKELLVGSSEDIAAGKVVQELGGRSHLKPVDQAKLKNARLLRRRLFLRQSVAAVTAAVTVGAGLSLFIPDGTKEYDAYEGLYQSLSAFRDKEIPVSVTRRIATDLFSRDDFPSLKRSAMVIIDSIEDPKSVTRYDPVLRNAAATIRLQFKNIGNDVATFEDKGRVRTTKDKLMLTRKDSGQVASFLGVTSESTDLVITFSNALVDVGASAWVYRLMVAKEASHPLYMSAGRRKLMDELESIYQFPHDQNTADVLMATAMSAQDRRLRIPFVSPTFNRMIDIMDYAGYGHIALDLARIREKGLLTKKDWEILSINLQGVDNGIAQGLIVRSSKDRSRFEWKEGMSPMSEEWFKVMDDVHKRNP